MARQKTVVINGARQWVGDKKVTAPISSFSPSDSEVVSVSPLFARYYQSHGAAKRLGEPVTVAFPTKQGWLQFFEAGALLLPAPQQATTAKDADDALAELVKKGTKDPVSGIVSLPLFQELLTVGS